MCCVEARAQPDGPASELDEMWSYVGKKKEQRWLWHAIDHHSGTLLAYVFGRREDDVFLQLKGRLRATYRPREAPSGQRVYAENREQTHQSADTD